MRIELEGRTIPRNGKGDPAFADLPALQKVFSNDEITELVNRSLYQIEYQKNSHRKRATEQARLQQPVKRALKVLYPTTSFAKATEGQLAEAMKYASEHPELAREE